MPFRQHAGIGHEIKFTRSDHTIAIPRPLYDRSQGFESACLQCHSDQTEDALQKNVNEWWGDGKGMNPVIANRLMINNETTMMNASSLLLQPELNHSM
jgi:alkaline phosphatase